MSEVLCKALAARRLGTEIDSMEWATPKHSRNQVDWAGKILIRPFPPIINWEEWNRAYEIIDNWRSSHSYPLNTFQVTLRSKARKVDPNSVVAQRIKRLSSIHHKLDRFPSMQLSQIQDIGGCRAILETAEHVKALVESYRKSDLRHKLYRVTDYVESPRESGYRGVHLLYQYASDKESKAVYNGLRLEMQIRSSLQHAWATAVETVGTLTSQALKSSLGEADWLRFFALMGTVIALAEKCPPTPNTPTDWKVLIGELRLHTDRLNASWTLHTFGQTLSTLEQPSDGKAHYFLLRLDPAAQQVSIMSFRIDQSEVAAGAYSAIEKEIQDGPQKGSMAVLVSVDNISALRRAYPNYFLDTRVFAGILDDVLARSA